jgi:hypothetical protein
VPGIASSPVGKPARRDASRRILAEAERLITGPRNTTHGDYSREALRIGAIWAAVLDLPQPIPPEKVAACMIALKLARATAGTRNPDDWVDIVGYAALAAQVEEDHYGKP